MEQFVWETAEELDQKLAQRVPWKLPTHCKSKNRRLFCRCDRRSNGDYSGS